MTAHIQPLAPDVIARLSQEEQAEYLAHLEALYWAEGKTSFAKFIEKVEIPGTPTEDAEDDEEFYCARLTPASHHKLILDALQNVADGIEADVDGIMIFMPPGSAKSSFASVAAPAWLLGRNKGTNVIVATYGQTLADRFGRRVRHVARSKEFEQIMGCTITGDNQAVNDWSLTNGSTYKAVGIDGGVTGLRADWLIIDDPVKNRKDADSETIRRTTWDTWSDDLTSRYKPNMKIMVIMTRWHEDDLAGRLLGEEWKGQSGLWRGTDFRLWNIINLPMIAEYVDDPLGRKIGEQLWSEYFAAKDVDRLIKAAAKGGTAARTWSSLYQQRPAPAEGSILLRSYWKKWTKTRQFMENGELVTKPDPPECDFQLLVYDTAFEDGEENDYSAMCHWGIFQSTSRKGTGEEYQHHHAILLGAWRDKVQAADLADIIVGHNRTIKPDLIIIEKRASGITVLQELKRLRLPVKPWLPRGKPGTLGKIPRAHGVAMMLEQGAVHYIPGGKTEAVISECAAFPNGTNDDWVDCVTSGLIFFRDRFMFRTADEEPDDAEIRDIMNAKFDARKTQGSRRLYGGEVNGTRRAQNERRLYGGTAEVDRDEPAVKRMTDETRKRHLYGGG